MMTLKHILYNYIPIYTANSILAIFKQNTVLFLFDFTHDHSLAACSPVKLNEQQEIYMTSKFSETLYSMYKLYQISIRIKNT